MKQLLSIAILFLSALSAMAQDTIKVNVTRPDTVKAIPVIKTNPIIYADFGFGFGAAGLKGIMGSAGVNYQSKHNLFSLRYIGIADIDIDLLPLPFTAIPIGIKNNGSLGEYALLYGLRFPKNGHAFSFSLGASVNTRVVKYKDGNNNPIRLEEHYAGLPFEVNIMWFKAAKRRFRIYHIIPVGRPTGFGGSIGFKLSGNISRYSYAALGVIYGLGYHKAY